MCKIEKSDTEIDTFINERLINAKTDKEAIVLVGGPGSGKSSRKPVVFSNLNKNIEYFANIETDEIISKLFNNDEKCRQKVN